jgi:hypothetical protein
MARLFDPIKKRENFDRFLLKMELSKLTSGEPVPAGAAIQRLGTVVLGWLVGLQTQIDPVLKAVHAALKRSTIDRAPPDDIYIPAMRSQAFGLSQWMLSGDPAVTAYREAVDQFELHFQHGGQKVIDPDFFNKETQRFEPQIERGLPLSDEQITTGYLMDYLACCIQSKQFARGVSLYERLGAEKNVDPSRTMTVEEFGYWACRENLLHGEIPTDIYLSVGARVLRRHFQTEWLAHGLLLVSADWLKALYWHSGATATPLETILKAYELMPDVPRPAFV